MRWVRLFLLSLWSLGAAPLSGLPQTAAPECARTALGTALPADAGCPGPFAVARAEYNSATEAPQGLLIEGVDVPVDVWGLVSYPEDFPAGPAPLVLVLHGNRGTCGLGFVARCANPVRHHEGLLYLTDHLASQGFIAVSVNANRLNDGGFDHVLERGQLLLEHLRRWRQWATVGGAPWGERFVGRVDLSRIGLIGHSRGGEAVIAAFNLNRALPEPFAIGAVLSLAPTDKRGLSIQDVPYYAIVPACDGDVLDYRGVRFFDRALALEETTPSPKQVAFVLGANHNYFNTLWDRDGGCTGLTLIERAQQEALAKRLSAAFLRRYLWDEVSLHGVFTGDVAGPSDPRVPLWRSYLDPVRLTVDDFAHAPQAPNRLGGAASWTGFRAVATCGPGTAQACSVALVNERPALALRWLRAGATFRTEIPPGAQDVRGYIHLSLRAAQNPDDVLVDALKPEGEVVHFSVRLRDARGNEAQLSTRALGGVPFPVGSTVRDPDTGRPLRRNVLTTLRFPLAAFAGLDRSRIVQVTLVFDQSPRGSLYLSDLQFSR